MSIYQVKHKTRGRYGVIKPDGSWLIDFLGTKEAALDYADQLNVALETQYQSEIENNKITKSLTQSFVLTDKGWLQQED